MQELTGKILCVILCLAVSGCLSGPASDGGSSPASHPSLTLKYALVHPYLINATKNQSITYSYEVRSNCPFDAVPLFSYAVYDRDGLIEAEQASIDLAAGHSGEVIIPLAGTPPFVLAGQLNACVAASKSKISGVVSGHRLWSRTGYDLDKGEIWRWTNFTMPAGSRFAERALSPPEWSWYMDAAGADVRMPPATSGEIRLHYPDGTIARTDDYSLTSGHTARFPPFQWVPDDMDIVVDLDRPLMESLDVSYINRYRVFHEGICEHGVEWTLCGSPTPSADP